jgi:hypothetical protein
VAFFQKKLRVASCLGASVVWLFFFKKTTRHVGVAAGFFSKKNFVSLRALVPPWCGFSFQKKQHITSMLRRAFF